MAGAVANPQYMGYKALYRTVLEDSKRGIAKALRVFADPEAFPVLIHCIHGERAVALSARACGLGSFQPLSLFSDDCTCF